MRGDAAPLRTTLIHPTHIPSTVGGGYDKTHLPNPLIHSLIHHYLAACRTDDTHSSATQQSGVPPREHQKSIRRMRGVQDSVLPEGRGGEASPHISSPNPQWQSHGYMRPSTKR